MPPQARSRRSRTAQKPVRQHGRNLNLLAFAMLTSMASGRALRLHLKDNEVVEGAVVLQELDPAWKRPPRPNGTSPLRYRLDNGSRVRLDEVARAAWT